MSHPGGVVYRTVRLRISHTEAAALQRRVVVEGLQQPARGERGEPSGSNTHGAATPQSATLFLGISFAVPDPALLAPEARH